MQNELHIAYVGFGEAAQAFTEGMGADRSATLRGFDIKSLGNPEVRNAKAADFFHFDVRPCANSSEATDGATAIISLVTADQALSAAQTAAMTLAPDTYFFDGNSVSPQTKRLAAEVVERAGGRYVDMAIMSPVRPTLNNAPVLLSGPHSEAGAALLRLIGFSKVRVLTGPVGSSSSVKMIRSVMVKGIEALTAECLIAAVAAGVDGEVIASLDASEKSEGWALRGDYNLDRMMIHGRRRAEEMREVVATLEGLGVTPAMSRGTVAWQTSIGTAGFETPPAGYAAKVELIKRTSGAP